jgi:hypothetical protein
MLNCHVAAFTEHDVINIAGKTSYLTAFGSTNKVMPFPYNANVQRSLE